MNVLIVGSSNTDMTVELPTIPLAGETILGSNFRESAGGKGANQAVAASRLGANTTFITALGDDNLGVMTLDRFKKENINTDYIYIKEGIHSGVALIFVDKTGENCIGVASGANGKLTKDDIQKAKNAFVDASVVVLQLEIPMETVIEAAKLAKENNAKVILNPAPMQELPKELLENVDIITPNETELATFAGNYESLDAGIKALFEFGISYIVVTLGKKGAKIISPNGTVDVEPYIVKPVDTVGAGDCFNAGVAVGLAENDSIEKACKFAGVAAALSTTKIGAQNSMPYREDVVSKL